MLFLLAPINAVAASQARKIARLLCALVALVAVGCERQPAVVPTLPTLPAQPVPLPAPLPAAVATSNAVATYFSGAEIQAETDEQRAEVRKALADMLALNADELKAKRYADFAGTANRRTVVELIANHVVPSAPHMLDASVFFADVKSPQAQIAVRAKLDELNKSSGSARP